VRVMIMTLPVSSVDACAELVQSESHPAHPVHLTLVVADHLSRVLDVLISCNVSDVAA